MQTQRIIDHLTRLHIPSFWISAVQELGQQDLSLKQAIEQIVAITDTTPNVSDIHEARLMYQYLVQDGLRLRSQGVENVDTKWILESALGKARAFKKKHPYVFATGEDVAAKVNEKSEVKQKKGWKQARVIELRDANPNMDRKELIQLFMKECDMTLACATTYYHSWVRNKQP